MTERHGDGIGGIGARWEFWQREDAQQHGRHLLLAGVAISGDTLLHALGGVLAHGEFALHGGCDGHPLRTSELQHALHVLAEELGLNREFIRVMALDDTHGLLEDRAQLQRVIIRSRESDGTGLEQTNQTLLHAQYPKAHHGRAGVDAKNDPLRGRAHQDTLAVQVNADEGTVSRRTLLLLRWSVFLLACLFLYVRFSRHGGGYSMEMLDAALRTLGLPLLVGQFLLMSLNWSIEALKWRLLMQGIERIGAVQAFAATLAGTSIGLITPNRIGEFVGRVLFLRPENRVAGSFATTVGSIAQFIVTVVLGMAGVVAVTLQGDWQSVRWISAAWIGVCTLVAAASLMLYYNPGLLRAVAARLPLIRRWERHAGVLERFSPAMLTRVLLMSAVRYAVFTAQFAWLLHAIVGIPWQGGLASVPAAFLVGTLIPTVMVTELGVRGSVAVALISPAAASDQGVFTASALLWLINLAAPAMAGAIIMLTARIRADRP